MVKSKKGQGMPMNVVILAIIVIVVLIIVLIILVGGTTQFVQAVKRIVTGRISAQSLELSVKDCETFCESAKTLPTPFLKQQSDYCTETFIVELDKQLTKVSCGTKSNRPKASPEEQSKGVVAGQDLGVNCDIACAA